MNVEMIFLTRPRVVSAQIRFAVLLMVSSTAFFLACGNAGVDPPTEPTEEDAIFNIIRYDYPQSFNLDLHDFSIPDTSLILGPPYQVVQYWRQIETDSLDIDIQVEYPSSGDSVGTVPQGIVAVKKFFRGSLEIVANDTAGGGSIPVRLSKSFVMLGAINAFFEKLGFDYNSRRGWVLRRISDAVFVPQPNAPPVVLPRIDIVGMENPGDIIRINTTMKSLSDLPEFSPGESLAVYVYADTTVIASLRFPSGSGYFTREMILNSAGVFVSGFTVPGNDNFTHFLVDLIPERALSFNDVYRPAAIGVLYRIR